MRRSYKNSFPIHAGCCQQADALVQKCNRWKRALAIYLQASLWDLTWYSQSSQYRDKEDQPCHAKAIAALCVGGMVVARAMNDRAAADELRDACMSVALDLGGWQGEGCINGQKQG
jgi:hypothetical protein